MKGPWFAIIAAFIALTGLVAWQVLTTSDEPVYKGKTLTSWLRVYCEALGASTAALTSRGQDFLESQAAVHHIGTNAIPTLLRLLRAKDSAWKVKLIDLLQRQKLIKFRIARANEWHFAASAAFFALGTNAQGAVPELLNIANQRISSSSQAAAIASLRNLGPAVKQAFPRLLQWTTNADPNVRAEARLTLYSTDPEAAARAGITNIPWSLFK